MESPLQLKTILELKQILKSKNLPITGKKNELIERINKNQPIKSKNYETYFDLLPSDLNKEIEKYRIENDNNRKALNELLTNKISIYNFLFKISYFTKTKTTFKKFFLGNNLDIEIVKQEKGGKFVINKLPIISDSLLQELIMILIRSIKSSFEYINTILKNNKVEMRMVSYWQPQIGRTFEFIKF